MAAMARKEVLSPAAPSSSILQGKCSKCRQKKGILQRSAFGPAPQTAPPIVPEAMRLPGQPLDVATPAFMGQRSGHDFSKITVYPKSPVNIQAKLAVNTPGDIYEQEADRIADQVMAVQPHHPASGASEHIPPVPAPTEPRLGHELAIVHVSAATNRGNVLQRQPASRSQDIEKENKDEWKRFETSRAQHKKRMRVDWHIKQQRNVANFLDRARKLQTDPKKGLMDPDNLFRNTVELLDSGKFALTVLSPTHYRSNLYFDITVPYPKIGGDYPAEPNVPGNASKGLFFDYEGLYTNALGANRPPPPSSNPNENIVPTKVERAPGETRTETKPGLKNPESVPDKTSSSPPVASSFIPGNIYLFTHDLEITEDQFKNTLIHEGQHLADLEPRREKLRSCKEVLRSYKSEFRAFWIQPPVPPSAGLAGESINRLPEPKGKARNLEKVRVFRPEGCKICPSPSPSAPAEVKTGMKNPRQEEIFLYILSRYKTMEFDCCYVFNDKFRNEVNQFAFPQSINLINSDRLMNLNLELQKLKKSMTPSEVSNTRIVILLTQLEPLDWIFLKDRNLSNPFWEALNITAPMFLYKGVEALVQKGSKNPVSEADVYRELTRN